MLGCVLERVAPRQRQDLLVGGDEVGHPGRRADDERLARRVQVRLGPRQHPHARQLKNTEAMKITGSVTTNFHWSRCSVYVCRWLTVGTADATVATAAALAPASVASAIFPPPVSGDKN